MPLRTFTLTKTPGEGGFVDEFNAMALELAAAANKILRCDLISLEVGATTQSLSIPHGLGVVPDFLWALDTGLTSGGLRLTVSASEKDTWSKDRIRFTPNAVSSTLLICVIALT